MPHIASQTDSRACDQHGPFEAVLWRLDPMPTPKFGQKLPQYLEPFWSKCPACDAAMQAEADAIDAAIRGGGTAKELAMMRRQEASNIPVRYLQCTVWNWQSPLPQQKPIAEWAREYCTSFDIVLETGRCGVFTGAPGSGKTHLAVGLLRHVLEKGGGAYYTTVMDLLGRVKATFGRNAEETEAKVMAHVNGVDLLVVDEVGRQIDSNYEQAQFFRVLDSRYRGMKPTILVSNLPKPELVKYLGAAVVDRLAEAGGKLFLFDWMSQRDPKKRRRDTDE